MSLVLGIDCCTRWTSVGCCEDGAPLGDISLDLGRRQSALLPFLVEQLLRNVEATLSDVDLIAVTTGPGAFTGARVGVAYASALAEGLGVRIAPMSTLKVLAMAFPVPEFLVVPYLRARKGQYYLAAYRFAAVSPGDAALPNAVVPPGAPGAPNVPALPAESVLEPTVLAEEEVARFLAEHACRKMLVGVGMEHLAAALGPEISLLSATVLPGSTVALLGEFSGEKSLAPQEVRLDYLRGADIG
ncbi:tRNA (adenosine(37)-N6)-threonylcarbamoyltransferase complex dimerization subunit type 1 TsaB [Aminiphilus circumscriptus]|jgi:tRNA threonylcarbamoyladenosine biosynthesis protein TsaB|uniref:tRNA (adenosine(37)-N6)-threonylcarbamoyltransferase complex dimerization subunit type 1 TsaB n=1 Tax=Aminiphilus circumscriptus TaxID=290732 RepID=UPI000492DFAE|nr:tRNA (adenosine(37)-N6)-threonylcarbamoyltransferase complex dimerization subunit type 1 TsaB [Aminiphilus circumscriptus]